MAIAGSYLRRVGLHVAKCLDRQPQQIGGDLRIRRLMAHAVGLRAYQQRDSAIILEAQFRAFVRCATCGFHEACHANAAQSSVPLRQRFARRKACMVRGDDGIIQVVGKPAAIDNGAKSFPIRELPHQIAPAQIRSHRSRIAVPRHRSAARSCS